MSPHDRKFHVFSIKERVESFRYAFKGVWTLIITQHNAWVHVLATILVVCAGFFVKLSAEHWIMVLLATSLVWVAEALNTAMEFLCDATIPEFHPLIEKAKDVAAGAVLISALAAIVVGVLIFKQYLVPESFLV